MNSSPSASKTIRILVADANRMASDMLARTLSQATRRFEVVASVWDAAGVMTILSKRAVDVALLSLALADGPASGLAVLRHVCAGFPKTRAILLAEAPERELVIDTFRSGSRGIFCRNESLSQLRKCISTVHAGQIWANKDHLEFIFKALQQACLLHMVDANDHALLAPRETEVVLLVAEGLPNREIARRLNLTEHTVRNYLFRVFEKLGVSNRVELVLYAISQRDQTDRALPHTPVPDSNGRHTG
jgi:DNA-binding NarL/FixJ family response regulator